MQKSKLMNSKKGINDVSILISIFLIMISSAIIIPIVQNTFNAELVTEFTTDDFTSEFSDDTTPTSISNIGILESISRMFFWFFGTLPFFLEIFFIVLKLSFWILMYRQVRSGAG